MKNTCVLLIILAVTFCDLVVSQRGRARNLENRIKNIEKRLGIFSAFTASASTLQLLNQGDVIKFDRIHVNINGDYKAIGSAYTCPQNGIYYFTFTINSFGMVVGNPDHPSFPHRAHAALYLDNTRVVDTLSYNHNKEYIISSSTNAATVFCKKGQKLTVRSDFDDNASWSFFRFPRTTFSGFYLGFSDNAGADSGLLTDNARRQDTENADGIL